MLTPTSTLLALIDLGAGELLVLTGVLAALAFWLWMIADCATHETNPGTKTAWILAIILLGPIAAPFYFFVRKRPRTPPHA